MIKFNNKKIKCLCAAAGACVMSAILGFNGLNITNTKAKSNISKENYYVSEFESKAAVQKEEAKVGKQIANEGVVLLKNEENALPLKSGAKLSVFGKNIENPFMYNKAYMDVITFYKSLTDAGFSINPELVNFYKNPSLSGYGRQIMANGQFEAPGLAVGETPVSQFTPSVKDSIANYNDAAIVFITRESGEGRDFPRSMWKDWSKTTPVDGARKGDDHYLQPDQNEADLIKYCGDHFDNVIIVFNVPAQFESGFLNDPGHYAYHKNIKAAIWSGIPANEGFSAIGKILNGDVNPSGKMATTWARDYTKDPIWTNFSNNRSSGTAAQKGNQYSNRGKNPNGHGWNPDSGMGHNYVNYKEGIYVGYRYWETRGFLEGTAEYDSSKENNGDPLETREGILGTTTQTWNDWYDAHVLYPFGHGLSYTTFTQEIVDSTPEAGTTLESGNNISVKVKVTNTGKVPGKDVVQIYYTAPYIDGEIEKSHVNLVGFEKTKILEPGESEVKTVTFPVRDMASFDFNDANKNGKKTFELDGGDYVIRLMKNSHVEVANVRYNIPKEGIAYLTDNVTNNEIKPLFDNVSYQIPDSQYTVANSFGYKGYLSRSNFKETFPVTDYKIKLEESRIKEIEKWGHPTRPDPSDDNDKPYYTTTAPKFNVKKGILLRSLHGLSYDDPKWDEFLNQLDYSQMQYLICHAGYKSGADWSEYGIKEVKNCDDASGISNGSPGGTFYGWPRDFITACTWNKELVHEKGRLFGDEALWGSGEQNSQKVGGMYAPAINIHRSPFSGRNNEYWGEDSLLAGKMAAQWTKGCVEKGLPCFVKHFAINDQETDRFGVLTWLNEQAMREVYIRQFEIVIKEAKPLGVMTALNRIGTTWCGGNYALNTALLRNEWGFRGVVLTDSWAGTNTGLNDPDQMIRAGNDLCLGSTKLKYNVNTPTTMNLVRTSCKNLLYMHANSNIINEGAYPVAPKPISKFEGSTIKVGILNLKYEYKIATAKVNDELYPDVDDSEIKYTVAKDSKLPDGLTLAEDGTISGKPTSEANNFRFKVDATFDGYTKSAEFVINIISPNGAIVYGGEVSNFNTLVGDVCDIDIASASIVKPDATEEEMAKLPKVKYAIKNGSILPEGLELTEDGKITGAPTKVCNDYKFTVQAYALGYKAVEKEFTISINYNILYEGSKIASGRFGDSYCENVAFAKTDDSVEYTLKETDENKLPKGLILTKQGTIVGIPEEAVTDYSFVVVAKGQFTDAKEATFIIDIKIGFNSSELMDGKVGDEYFGSVATAQGADDIVYKLKDGSSLPEGMTISEYGDIEGTAKVGGVYKFTVVAESEGKISDEAEFTLFVEGQAPKTTEKKDSGCGSSINNSLLAMAPVVLASLYFVSKKKRRN